MVLLSLCAWLVRCSLFPAGAPCFLQELLYRRIGDVGNKLTGHYLLVITVQSRVPFRMLVTFDRSLFGRGASHCHYLAGAALLLLLLHDKILWLASIPVLT